MAVAQEFETTPVDPSKLQPARFFAASYAGEHVAGTEFVIGAMFVAWGVSAADVIWGLLWGNLLAVLMWGLICAPIATQTRLTLYAYLERIAGPGTIKLYSAVNGIMFCILAGAMITVSASAVRILFDIPPQVNWYPTDFRFVLVVLGVGAVVVAMAVKGFRRVAQFAEVCAPWMILMFIAGALALYPVLNAQMPAGEDTSFMAVAEKLIWTGSDEGLGFWHVAAFAWICNLAMHGSLSDMTMLRYARRSSYGYFSAFGMFLGHYMAWVCAGIMGAGAALIAKTSIDTLDPGAVAYQALGAAGIIAVIIAGWTTSNPTIYRAGLAFHSLNPKWDRSKVTLFTGIVTTIIACSPFVFGNLLNFVGLMGLTLMPVGAVIVTEHWIFPRLGLTRYWAHYADHNINWAAIGAWFGSLAIAYLLNMSGVHLFFLLLPTWLAATALYLALASVMGAKEAHTEQATAYDKSEDKRRALEAAHLEQVATEAPVLRAQAEADGKLVLARAVALVSLLVCAVLSVRVFTGGDLESLRSLLIWPTLVYFIAATIWVIEKDKIETNNTETS
ncbi:MAG: hypothetical protein JKY34_05895 [Kordiimonadaceae bacterium]|nr:hypothetical protein [Kordiimonadaceae bacterium]